MNWNEIAEKVKNIILEKQPKNLVMTVYENEILIYTDEGLVDKISIAKAEETVEEKVEESQSEFPTPSEKRSTPSKSMKSKSKKKS
ncbi:MAG TPA: hypothetical protein ENG10_02280 [Candidatus Bathyarchaeota archaeon]|nr:hypothetical protein [Candidatus Bathyarchaeota archaeon]HEX69106.1 hypothetical protein [Candidatus Bathyarchaeota archaeon]